MLGLICCQLKAVVMRRRSAEAIWNGKYNHFNCSRERTPMLLIAYALFLYFSGLSLRRVSTTLVCKCKEP